MLQLALTRLLEIVGEAATRVPADVRALRPTIPWRQITGLRNRLIHGYETVDFDVIWLILEDDVPVLIEQLNAMLAVGE